MRIVHYIESVRLSIGGTVRAALDMCAGLASAGHDVALLTLDDTDVPPDWREGREGLPKVVRLPAPSGLLRTWTRAQREVVGREIDGADVVHIHAMWAPTNEQVASMARARGIAYVVTAHGMLDEWAMAQKSPKKRVYLALSGRKTLERAGAVHFTADEELRQSRKWFRADRAVSVPLLFDSAAYETLPSESIAREKFGLREDGAPILLFLSRFTSGKRADLVIEAAKALRDRGVALRLVLAGAGDASEEARLREMVNALGLRDATTFTGAVFGEEKVSLYRCAAAFALPSDHENFCFALVEAMAAGAPSVTVKTVAIWEELSRSGGAVVVEPNARAVADALEPMLRDSEVRERMGRAARAYVLREMSARAVVAKYERMYEMARRG